MSVVEWIEWTAAALAFEGVFGLAMAFVVGRC